MDYYSAIKNEIMPWYLESMVLSEMSDGERQTLCDFTHMWNIKYKQNKWIDQIKQNTEVQGTEWWLPEEWGYGEGEMDKEGQLYGGDEWRWFSC